MQANNKAAMGYKVVFTALGSIMLATLIYTIATAGSPFRPQVFTPWMVATLLDFYINVAAISTWVIYKEESWFTSLLWVTLLVCFGSISTCAYIVTKLCENPSHHTTSNPLELLLVRNSNLQASKRPSTKTSSCSFSTYTKVLFGVLGMLMAVVLVYTIITDGLPFRIELLTPWMLATLVDFYINVSAISVWVGHKEATCRLASFVWICLLICFGSITTCAYIFIQLRRADGIEKDGADQAARFVLLPRQKDDAVHSNNPHGAG